MASLEARSASGPASVRRDSAVDMARMRHHKTAVDPMPRAGRVRLGHAVVRAAGLRAVSGNGFDTWAWGNVPSGKGGGL